ncbi:hypothetical protein BH11MYX3_BH11MYX3_25820 [soil metagenome]
MRTVSTAAVSLISLVMACGPAGRPHTGDDDDGIGADASGTTGPEICDDAYDNDGDGRADCSDTDCSGVGACPVCGSVENPQATPLALPDGVSSGATCTTDADCASTTGTPNCVAKECHASYTSTLNFVGFPMNATLTDATKLLNVCVDIEHSFLRDLQIELITPPDSLGARRVFVLHKFVSRSGGEVYLGGANDGDEGSPPVPGTGATYCWDATAMTPMLTTANVGGPTHTVPSTDTGPFASATAEELNPGNYKPMSVWSAFQGVSLNGEWTMRVTDLWHLDNGFMFKGSIKFDPSLVLDCSGPIIL